MDREQEEAILRITAQYVDEVRAGQRPKVSDYLARYPQYAAEIADFVAYYHTVEPPPPPATPITPPPPDHFPTPLDPPPTRALHPAPSPPRHPPPLLLTPTHTPLTPSPLAH